MGELALTGGEQVLDVAAGTGHTTLPLARRLPRGRVTAIDISPAMLGLLRGIAAKLKTGGSLVVSTFTDATFAPRAGLMDERLAQYGFPVPPRPSKRVASSISTCAV